MADDEDRPPLDPLTVALMAPSPPAFPRGADFGSSQMEYLSLIKAQRRLVQQLAQANPATSRQALHALRTRMSELEARAVALETEVSDLKHKNAALEDLLKREELNPNSRTSLERLTATALVAAYGLPIDPEKRSPPLAPQVAHDAALAGIKIDPKTIRAHIKAAAKHVVEE